MQTLSVPQGHVPVLLQEALDGLNLKASLSGQREVFVDCTLGSAGHSLEVFRRFGNTVRIIGLDADPTRIAHVKEILAKAGCTAEVFNENFRNLDSVLSKLGIAEVSAVLFDLGLNSEQLESSDRGFSFKKDEPLLMTFAEPKVGDLTAREIVNNYDEDSLKGILEEYGEERQARGIVRAIIAEREKKSIETTFELIEAIRKGYRGKYPRSIHFATRTFQALRIATNDETGALTEGLSKAFEALGHSGRMAVISFHSLEDRIVKRFNKEQAEKGNALLITKKPTVPTDEECAQNPRSRSAKLRILEKI